MRESKNNITGFCSHPFLFISTPSLAEPGDVDSSVENTPTEGSCSSNEETLEATRIPTEEASPSKHPHTGTFL